MYKYGFELEGFFRPVVGGEIHIPPSDYPHDGFPGLCEARSFGGSNIDDAYYQVLMMHMKFPFDINACEHTFQPAQKLEMRRTRTFTKEVIDICNVYGKNPRALGNRTLASFQINMSNLLAGPYTDDKGVNHTAHYGLLNIPNIVKRLDKEFAAEITAANRQPGFYAIKDGIRLEYRSLPNNVFRVMPHEIKPMIDRIKRAVEGS